MTAPRHLRIFFLTTLIGLVLFAALMLALWQNIAPLPLSAFASRCREWVGAIVAAIPSRAGIAAAIGGSTFAIFALSLARNFVRTRECVNALSFAALRAQPATMRRALAAARLAPEDIRVVEAEAPFCFSAGLFRPRVYLSSMSLRILGDSELSAVLAHEAAHLRTRDPLQSAILRALRHAFFFLPVIGALEARHAAQKEIAADAAAIGAGAPRRSLVRALYTLSHPRYSAPPFAAPFAEYAGLDARIAALAGIPSPALPLPRSAIFVTLLSIGALFFALTPSSVRTLRNSPACEAQNMVSTSIDSAAPRQTPNLPLTPAVFMSAVK